MTSRERVLCAIKNELVDRPCSNFRAEQTFIRKILDYTGIKDTVALQDILDTDIRHIDAIVPADIDNCGISQNIWGERFIIRQTDYGVERESIDGAFADMKDISEFSEFKWVHNDELDYSNIANLCEKHKGRAIMYGSGDVWQRATMMRGLQNYMIDMYENPEACHFLSNKLTEFYIEDYRRAYEASNKKIDIFLIYSDLGSQRAPLISLEMLKLFVLPYIKRIADAIHEMGAYLFFHTCGMVSPFIYQLIETGIDILDPIQPVCETMQPEILAEEFCGKICFHGGIDIQNVLIYGSEADVKNEVKRYIDTFANKCGYICAPSHFLQKDIPVKNVIALYKAIKN